MNCIILTITLINIYLVIILVMRIKQLNDRVHHTLNIINIQIITSISDSIKECERSLTSLNLFRVCDNNPKFPLKDKIDNIEMQFQYSIKKIKEEFDLIKLILSNEKKD